jgi:hypothetical protein
LETIPIFLLLQGRTVSKLRNLKLPPRNKKKRKLGNDDDDDANAITAEITVIEIASTFESVIASCREQPSIDATTTGKKVGGLKYTAAIEPLVDGILDLRSRCLIAVILGNDTFPKELKVDTCLEGIGVAAIRDMLRDIRAEKNLEARSDISYSLYLLNCGKSF